MAKLTKNQYDMKDSFVYSMLKMRNCVKDHKTVPKNLVDAAVHLKAAQCCFDRYLKQQKEGIKKILGLGGE